MASVPSSSPSSESRNSATDPIQPKREVDDVATKNGVSDVFEKKPDLIPQHFHILNRTDYIEKYKKYEVDCTWRLMAKYFSKKDLYGGNIFEENTTIDDEIIMSSRWPCTRSFAEPMQGFEDQNSRGSSSTPDSPDNISNGKLPPRKNS